MRTLILVCLLMLVGCSQAPKKPIAPTELPKKSSGASIEQEKSSWEQHKQQLANVNHWQAKGRLAAVQGKKGGNASFVWEQKGDSYLIKLFGPFGSGAVYITGHPQFVELKEANGKTTRAQSPELLLKKVAGWQIPLTGLRHWLRGIPAPGETATERLNDRGFLSYLDQQGWKINYENYHTDQFPPLPNKLQLQNGNVKIKMVITSWQNS